MVRGHRPAPGRRGGRTANPLSRGSLPQPGATPTEEGIAHRRAVSEAKYQRDPNRFAGLVSDFARWAVERLPTYKGARLVELGCGPGRDLAFYADRGYASTGVDFAPTAIERARERFAHLPEPARSRGRFVLGDGLAYLHSQPEGSVDAVVANLVYPTFGDEELRTLFAEVARCLRPSGVHAYSVRTLSDPLAREGDLVGTDTRQGGPHEVAYRFYSAETLAGLPRTGFEPGDRMDRKPDHLLYAADRRP